jgi:hypothetical protein
VLRSEDLIDEPHASQRRLLRFLGVKLHGSTSVPTTEYAELHAASLVPKSAKGKQNGKQTGKHSGQQPLQPAAMQNRTRQFAADFYQPHNERLAVLLGDRRFLWK